MGHHDTACLGPRPGEDLSDQVLAATNSRWKSVDAILQREILNRVIRRAKANGALKFFAGAADRAGFVGLIAGHIIQASSSAFDDFAKSGTDQAANRKMLGLG